MQLMIVRLILISCTRVSVNWIAETVKNIVFVDSSRLLHIQFFYRMFFQIEPISGLSINVQSSNLHDSVDQSGDVILEWGDDVIATITMNSGTYVMIDVDYGDGETSKKFVSNWTMGSVVSLRHGYKSLGEFNVAVKVKNSINESISTKKITIHDNVENIDFDIASLATPGYLEVRFRRTDNASATLHTSLTLDYGDDQTPVMEPNFDMAASLNHTYNASGVYELTASFKNPIGKAEIKTQISVIEPLEGVKIHINKGKYGLPVEDDIIVEFDATKGSNVTIEYYYGDGSSPEKIYGG